MINDPDTYDGRIYIAGPMSGVENYNFPAFHRAEETLEELFVEADIVCPAEDDDINEDGIPQMTRAEFLKRDFDKLIECDAIALLDGWKDFRGARAETHIAHELELDFLRVVGDKQQEVVFNRNLEPKTILREIEDRIFSPESHGNSWEYASECADAVSSMLSDKLSDEMDELDVFLFRIASCLTALKHRNDKRNVVKRALKHMVVLYRRLPGSPLQGDL